MKNIRNYLARFTKRAKFAFAATLMTLSAAVPAVGNMVDAQSQVRLESFTHAQNISKTPDTPYGDNTQLDIDEVARVQLWYHNRESFDSGKDANNLRVKFAIPNTAGKKQVITGTASADNADAVSDTTTINLTHDRVRLEVVPNSAAWRYNKGAMDGRKECQTGNERVPKADPHNCFATKSLTAAEQKALVSSEGLVIEKKNKPCFAYEATVTVQVRAVVEIVEVTKYVREIGTGAEGWKRSMSVVPGQKVEYLIHFTNRGNKPLTDVVVGDNLPLYHDFVGNVKLSNSGTSKEGVEVTNGDLLVKGGLNVGDYNPGASANVWFTASIKKNVYEKCGEYVVRNVGIVNPKELNPYYSTAEVKINNKCKEQPKPKQPVCDLLELKKLGGRKIEASVKYTANGATFRTAKFDFGDGSEPLVTNQTTVNHTYEQDGNYTVTVTLTFRVNDKDVTVGGADCAAQVSFKGDKPEQPEKPEKPRELPKTGVGSMVSLFTATTVAGAAAHRMFYGRREQ